MNNNLSDFSSQPKDQNSDNQPFLSSDPLADSASPAKPEDKPVSSTSGPTDQGGTSSISKADEDKKPEPAPTPTDSSLEVDYTKPENKELARKHANELIDQGKFEEAAKILRESGMHQTVMPAPPKKEPVSPEASRGESVPPVRQTQDKPVPPTGGPSIPPTAPTPQAPLDTTKTEEATKKIPPAQVPQEQVMPGQPEPGTKEKAIPLTQEPLAPKPEEPVPTPPPPPTAPGEPTPSEPQAPPPPQPTPHTPDTTPPSPEPTPSVPAEAPTSTPPPPTETPAVSEEIKHPDDYLKKAYDLRRDLLEYDRTKVAEEEKLQAAEELVFEGKHDEAVKIYQQIAREAEEKGEKEIAIEAYERLATLLR